MMRKYGYLVVEGPHDVELACCLFKPYGLHRVQLEKNLDATMAPLIPRTFPHSGDLLKRVPVPWFVQSDSHAIAIHAANGDSRLAATIEENSSVLTFSELVGVGLILDSDLEHEPQDRYNAVATSLRTKGFELPAQTGQIANGPPRLGAFVLPDNLAKGNLEDILIECANTAYPTFLQHATHYVDSCSKLGKSDGEDLAKPSVRKKAIVGAVATALKPGRAVQNSIQDNSWLKGSTLALPRVAAVQKFLADLFDLQVAVGKAGS